MSEEDKGQKDFDEKMAKLEEDNFGLYQILMVLWSIEEKLDKLDNFK